MEHLAAPYPPKLYQYDNIYATGTIFLMQRMQPMTRSQVQRNTLTLFGRVMLPDNANITPNFRLAPNTTLNVGDLFFDGDIYISADSIAEMIEEYLPSSK